MRLLQAWWRPLRSTREPGSTVSDLSGNANNGTITNATWSTAGRFGNALSFNGTDSLVTVNDSNSLDLTTGMTLEAWVQPIGHQQLGNGHHEGASRRVGVFVVWRIASRGPPASYITPAGTSSDIGVMARSTLPLNTWSHLAATYDGTTIRLYVNGNLISSSGGGR